MWYDFYMNKDVIYIEPEDDITDIINKIEKSKEKIVALVPPKKAGVFRSIVNIKLIAKAGATAEKSVVLVTVDPSITKLAAATKLPVAKNLQSAPVIPTVDSDTDGEDENSSVEDLDENLGEEEEEIIEEKPRSTTKSSKSTKKVVADDVEDEDEEEEDEEPAKTAPTKKEKKEKKLSGNRFFDWIKLHKKLSIFGGVVCLALIAFLVWAFGFAPAVDVTVAIKTDSKNFSENITFTDVLTDENAKEGKFFLEQKKVESTQEVKFDATGQKNVGEKARGDVVVYAYFKRSSAVAINAGSKFTVNGLSYYSTENATLTWNGEDSDACDNKDNVSSLIMSGCQVSERIKVEAANAGSEYNIGASNSGWSTIADVEGVYSDKAMAGGTDDIKTVVQQSDIEKAKTELTSSNEEEMKDELYKTIDDKYYIIESSFEVNTASAEASPAVDQEVSGDTKPVLKATTTASVYVIDKVKLEEFINAKAELEDNQKIYEIKDIHIENITQIASGSTAKLKAHLYIGPKITESEVVDKIKGKGLGDAGREIRDIYGVSDVKMTPSYPWVMAVPGDSNKVTVRFEVKDQDGNEINSESDGEESEDNGDTEQNTDENKANEDSQE